MKRGQIVDKVYTKYEKEAGKLRLCGGSWTVNLQDVDISQIDKIVYITEKATYTISMQDAMKHGFQRLFSKELKLVVAMKYWERIPHNV